MCNICVFYNSIFLLSLLADAAHLRCIFFLFLAEGHSGTLCPCDRYSSWGKDAKSFRLGKDFLLLYTSYF